MCDFGSADNSSAVMATQKARDEANAALTAQLKATTDATAAADTNSENSRRSSEAAMRRLASGAMFGAGGAALPSSAGTVFTRELFGQ